MTSLRSTERRAGPIISARRLLTIARQRVGEEIVGPFGYINDERRHVLVSIRNPSLTNTRMLGGEMLQFAITIENAIVLRAALNAFLAEHGVAEN